MAEIDGSLFAIHSEKQKRARIGSIDCVLNAREELGLPVQEQVQLTPVVFVDQIHSQ